MPWHTFRASHQQNINIISRRTENTVTNAYWTSEAQMASWPSLPRRLRISFKKRKCVSVFFSPSKSFDKVWHEGLLLKILESGVSGRMYRWIQRFLHDRSARVKLDEHLSKSVKMRGAPQEGVISPTPFLLYINIITTVLPRHVSKTLHTDDLAVWNTSEYITSSAYRIQGAVNKVKQTAGVFRSM